MVFMLTQSERIKQKTFKKIYKIFYIALVLSFIFLFFDAVIFQNFFIFLFYWICILIFTSSLVNYYLTFKKRIITTNYSVINFIFINIVPILIITLYRYGSIPMTSIYFVIIIIGALLLKQKEAIFISVLIVFLYSSIVFLELFNIIQPLGEIYFFNFTKIIVDIISLFLVTILVSIISKNAKDSMNFYIIRSVRLSQIRKRLEVLVKKRTSQLEASNKKLREAQSELRKNYKELQKLDVEKDQFISIAAHELKTPLTAIGGYSQLLKRNKIIKNAKKRKQFLDILDSESKRLSQLVSDILNLSRIDLGIVRYNLEKVDIYNLMNLIKDEFSLSFKERDLEYELKLEKNLPKIETDRDKLYEIITNLVSNALKYTIKGKVTVDVKKKEDKILISVSDTGMGIPKKYYKKMFTRFFQVDTSLRRQVGGSGLGLSLCKEYVEKLGGEIWFKSKLKKGTTLFVRLPIKAKIKIKDKTRISRL